WVREFLNEENRGLDVLVEYLSFAQYAVTFDGEQAEAAGESSSIDSPWSRSIEDLHGDCSLPSPSSSVPRAARHSISSTLVTRSNTLPSRRTLKNSRLVCKKDDVHVCVMCLRAVMNYQVACMQFINIVVHSVEDMNFRVHLQYDFTKLNLDEHLERLKHTESDRLQVQIQAYLDNVFDVGTLLEDAETKTAALERVEELEENLTSMSERLLDVENEAMIKIVELEKQLMQTNKELDNLRDQTIRRQSRLERQPQEAVQTQRGEGSGGSPTVIFNSGLAAVKIKKPIQTKFRMPVLNWVALKPSQINGTVFNDIDDEAILQDLDVEEFEEQFKTKAQGPAVDVTLARQKLPQKVPSKVSLLDANRAKNLAITLRKAGQGSEVICHAIHTFDLRTVRVDFVECLMRFLPTEAEVKLLRQYERDRKPLEALSDEDRFMMAFSRNRTSQPENEHHDLHGQLQRQHAHAHTLSLENVLSDVKELQRGMELTWREFSMQHNGTLKDFISRHESRLSKLQEDARIAQDAFEDVVKFFGESSKTMPPSVFFPIFVRFIKAYRLAEEENEQRRRQEQMLLEKLEQEEQQEEETKSPSRGKRQQQELITELRRRQGKDSRHVYEGKDGAIEDIISAFTDDKDDLHASVRRRSIEACDAFNAPLKKKAG
ncbi:unnamed protein product, partial [Lampetra planeri]